MTQPPNDDLRPPELSLQLLVDRHLHKFYNDAFTMTQYNDTFTITVCSVAYLKTSCGELLVVILHLECCFCHATLYHSSKH